MRITSADDLLPLTPQVYHMLLALADRPLHGYGIMLQVAADSGGMVTISSGSLYVALKRLRTLGLISNGKRMNSNRSPYQRVQYQLNQLGRDLVGSETDRMSQAAHLAKYRLRKA